ncbi:MAG: hypothetical protein AAF648_11420 [Pseudomonadota bacterium]
MRLLATLLLSFLATAVVATAFIVVGPGELRTRAFSVVLITPLLWAGLMVYAYWDSRAWRPAALYATTTALAGTLLYTNDLTL